MFQDNGLNLHIYNNFRYDGVPCKPLTAVEVMDNGKRVPIHANWIPTHGHPHRFIATQGPLDNTCEDFWAMCVYHNVDKIAMLCLNVEKNVKKCAVYFASDPPSKLDIGRFQITTQSRQLILRDNVIERKLLVKDTTLVSWLVSPKNHFFQRKV